MGDFNHLDICWRDSTAGHEQSRRFLGCVDDTFLLQVIEEPVRRGAMLKLVLTNKEGLVGSVKLKGSLGCSDHEMVEFKILRAARRAHSQLVALDCRREALGLFRDPTQTIPRVYKNQPVAITATHLRVTEEDSSPPAEGGKEVGAFV